MVNKANRVHLMTPARPRSLLQVQMLGFVAMALARQSVGRCIYVHECGLGQYSLLGKLSFIFCALVIGLSCADRRVKVKVDVSGQIQSQQVL